MERKLIGQLLEEKGLVQQDEIDKALTLQASVGGRLGALLIRLGALSEDALLPVLSCQLDAPLLSANEIPNVETVFPFMNDTNVNFEWFMSEGVALWLDIDDALVCLARDVVNSQLREVLRYHFPTVSVRYAIARIAQLDNLFDQLQQMSSRAQGLSANDDLLHLRELAEEAPIIEMVNNFMAQAVDLNASDIHIEPQQNNFAVRFRIDGVLHEQMTQPIERFAAVASRIKLISGLDIAERRLPQDGRNTMRISGQEMDIRVSTAPGIHGESIVQRLLPKDRDDLSLDNLGMESDHLALMRDWMAVSNGIILVTGPTGSGKSTTLYSALAATNDGKKKVITVEDPVEFQLPGITQIQAHAEIGYTFARALRAILRQDPDVIMIGEIRDLETAEIAIQSALTGHLVISTLHTNDAVSSFNRLIDMGVEPYLVAAPIKGVQAQRLVRKVCSECCQSISAPSSILPELKNLSGDLLGDAWVASTGCAACSGTGFKGRVGIYQMVPVDEKMQALIVDGASVNELKKYAAKQGFRSLYQDGIVKASNGVTTIEEVVRVAMGDQ